MLSSFRFLTFFQPFDTNKKMFYIIFPAQQNRVRVSLARNVCFFNGNFVGRLLFRVVPAVLLRGQEESESGPVPEENPLSSAEFSLQKSVEFKDTSE